MGNATKFHPLTGAPIVPLGYRKDGRAIWPIMGASDDPPPTDPPQDPPPSDPPPADPPKDPDDGKGGKDAVLADLAKERDKRQKLEQKFADAEAERTKQMEAFAVALGLKPEDTPPDPAKLAEQVSAEQSKTAEAETRATSAERKLAVFLAAGGHEANPIALVDSSSFMASIKDIDVSDADALGAAIKTAVEANGHFKTTTGSSTPPFPGGPRSTPPTQAGSLGDAIAGRLARTNR